MKRYASEFGFETLEAYKAAKQFRLAMFQLARQLPAEENYALKQQMRRAALSLTNNIAEGYGRFSWQDMTHFCRQAKGSLFELVDDLGACADAGYLSEQLAAELRCQAQQVHKLLNGYIHYLQSNKRPKDETRIVGQMEDRAVPHAPMPPSP